MAFLGSVALLVTTVTGLGGLAGFLIPLAVLIAAIGFSFPNAPAVALSRHGATAGTAAALLGSANSPSAACSLRWSVPSTTAPRSRWRS